MWNLRERSFEKISDNKQEKDFQTTPSTNAKKRSRFFQYNLLNNLLKKTRRKSNSHSEGSCHLVMKLLTGSAVAQPLFEVTPAFGHAELVTVGI